ncbi:serine acetyltransferase [Collinsella ihumii]|uniref:DapH/DapD/GlmU-related protein n=1 Tax=Collinsella ihumii TaxID=1720204 RepID=A0ABT7XHD2_9ACTN|nr:DapH/DapD/GlmU-related protein [Collinsella ihumii]MDN0064723.1 DapH/DapD/GlmU-related protein [Collinsella ihumii]
MNEFIASDLFRLSGKVSGREFIKQYLKSSGFRYLVAFRKAQGGGLLGRLLWLFRSRRNDIGIGAQIGYGLYIGHDGPVVINGTVTIGNNCNLSQFTTIGSNHDHAAKIGDNVYIGPNVCIVEDVVIGSNATIGAGSVVTKDIPENATAAGNYAKVLNCRNPGRYIKNPWPVKVKE